VRAAALLDGRTAPHGGLADPAEMNWAMPPQSCGLPNDERAPGQARRAVRVAFTTWRLGRIVEDAVAAASQLVTNAVRHGLPPVGLLLRRRIGLVRIDVEDARAELPTAGEQDALPESGRGLDIVRAVADDLGSEHIPGDGKFVYASWTLSDPPTAGVITLASM
jgi:hypothetical protein